MLHLTQGGGAFAGESVLRRLERLALSLELTASIETEPVEIRVDEAELSPS